MRGADGGRRRHSCREINAKEAAIRTGFDGAREGQMLGHVETLRWMEACYLQSRSGAREGKEEQGTRPVQRDGLRENEGGPG